MTSTDNGKTSAKFSQNEQGIARKISVHLVRLLSSPSVRERTISNLWEPIAATMSEVVSSEPTDVYAKRGKRVVMLLSEVSSIASEKQSAPITELAEKTADQLVQIVAKQCSGSMLALYKDHFGASFKIFFDFNLHNISLHSPIVRTLAASFLVSRLF